MIQKQHEGQRRAPQARFSIPREQPCVVYTDGSSNQARSHLERHVAWAIVRDHCTLDTQRVDYMQDWNRRNFALPPTFEVLQTGPVSLWQTVARAELTAILVSLCGANHAVVYSDSQYAVNLVNNILCQPDPKRYWKADNFDLVLAVCAIAPVCQAARICKIKAHQDLCAIPEPLAKYHAIGNAMADTAANAARATGFLDTAELISDLQASAALARAKTRMTMQFCAQATLAFLRHSKDKEDSQHLNAQPARCRLGMHITSTQAQALLWFCDPAYRQLDIPLLPHSEIEFAFWGVSYLSLLRNWLAALQWPSESQGEGSPDITWFELYLDFRIATQRNVPWNQGGTCDAPRYAMDPQPGYEIVPRPPLQQTLRNFASSVSHLATHLSARALPTFCVEVKRCNSLTRAFAFEAAVGLSCRPQLVCPSIFQTTLWMYSFRLLENVPLRLVNAVGPGLRELSLDALVLFRPSRLCASCTSHRGPIVPKLACSNLRPASPVGAWSLRKVPRKVPRSRTTCPPRSVSRKRRRLRVMGPLTAMKCPSSEMVPTPLFSIILDRMSSPRLPSTRLALASWGQRR